MYKSIDLRDAYYKAWNKEPKKESYYKWKINMIDGSSKVHKK